MRLNQMNFLFLSFLMMMVSSCQEKTYTYIFINETSDHRFDESIRMSILAAQKRTGVQNAVVISDRKLNAENLFLELAVGKKSKGKGILYVYSPKNHSLKIEVAYELEGLIPDMKVKALELGAKSFIYSERYQDFWAELINVLNIEIAKKGGDNFDYSKFKFLSGGAGISSSSYQNTKTQFDLESKKLSSPKEFLAQESVEQSLSLYLKSLSEGIGEDNLDLLTEESRLRRRLIPLTSHQLYRNTQMYLEAGLPKIFKTADLAFVIYPPAQPVLPIILRKEQKVWRVHEPLSWALFQRFEDSMRVFLKYPIEGIPHEMQSYLKTQMGEALYLKPKVSLEKLANPLSQTPSVEDFYFNLNWLELVIKNWSETENEEELWILADCYQNLGRFTDFLKVYKKLAKLYPGDKKIQLNSKFYEDHLVYNDKDWRLTF
jgi:hypothetical protein